MRSRIPLRQWLLGSVEALALSLLPLATAAAQTDPTALVQQFIAATNRGDAAVAAALFADTGILQREPWPAVS
jgi:hypothetical protein